MRWLFHGDLASSGQLHLDEPALCGTRVEYIQVFIAAENAEQLPIPVKNEKKQMSGTPMEPGPLL